MPKTKKLTTFQKVLTVQIAATVMAAKMLGRVIDQVARGFTTDPNLKTELSLYKAIQAKYPADTVTLPNMFKSMVRRAKTESEVPLNYEGMSEAEKELWNADSDLSEKDNLMAAMPTLTKLFMSAEPVDEFWEDLPTIAQWSILNSTEATLPAKLALYKGWADIDRAAGKTNTNGIRLEALTLKAIPELYDIVTEFLDLPGIQADLASDIEAGINVPPRLAVIG